MPEHEFVHDPVYGLIPLGQPWYELINRPCFQRLRRIRHNGTLFLVFPGSEHTRFTHTLGVLHLMRWLTEAYVNKREGAPYSDPYHWLVYCLGALFHDSAHLPFSHATEQVYASFAEKGIHISDLETPTGMFLQDDSLFRFGLVRAATLLSPLEPDVTYHESLAKNVIESQLEACQVRDLISEIYAEIRDINRRSVSGKTGTIRLDFNKLREDVAEAVSSPLGAFDEMNPLKSGIDVDKLDYLQRDSRAAGVCYGDIDLEHLLQHVIPSSFSPKSRGKRSIPTLAFNVKRLHTLEHMIMGRYFLYSNVINHPTNQAWTILLRAILMGLLQENERLKDSAQNTERCLSDPTGFYPLTDDYLDTAALSYLGNHEELRKLCDVWRSRKSPRLYWGCERLICCRKGGIDALTLALDRLLNEVLENRPELRRYVFPDVQCVRLLPRETTESKIDMTTYVVRHDEEIPGTDATEALPIQECPESVLTKLDTCMLLSLRVYVWGQNSNEIDVARGVLDSKNARQQLNEQAQRLDGLLGSKERQQGKHRIN